MNAALLERQRRQTLRVWTRGVINARLWRLEQELGHLLATPNAKTIHDARVAARRLRSTLRHLEPCFPPQAPIQLRTEIGRVAKLLGAVRDLDILIENLAADARRPRSPFTALVHRMNVQRERLLARALPEAMSLRGRLPAWTGRLET